MIKSNNNKQENWWKIIVFFIGSIYAMNIFDKLIFNNVYGLYIHDKFNVSGIVGIFPLMISIVFLFCFTLNNRKGFKKEILPNISLKSKTIIYMVIVFALSTIIIILMNFTNRVGAISSFVIMIGYFLLILSPFYYFSLIGKQAEKITENHKFIILGVMLYILPIVLLFAEHISMKHYGCSSEEQYNMEFFEGELDDQYGKRFCFIKATDNYIVVQSQKTNEILVISGKDKIGKGYKVLQKK